MHTKSCLENVMERASHKWENNIRLHLREIGWEVNSSGSG
jgi:hypothetical protein